MQAASAAAVLEGLGFLGVTKSASLVVAVCKSGASSLAKHTNVHRHNGYRLRGARSVILGECHCRGIKRLALPPVLHGGRGITRVVRVQALHVLCVCL